MTRIVLALLCGLLLTACGGSSSEPPEHPRGPLPKKPEGRPALDEPVDGFPSERVALVPDGTYGPYLGQSAEHRVAVWAQPDEDKRRWYTVALGEAGQRQGEPRPVADAPAEIGLVSVQPAGPEGFLVLATRGGTQAIEAFRLAPDGTLASGPTVVVEPSDPVLWIDAVATPDATLVLWAVRRETMARVYVAKLAGDGQVLAIPVVAVPDALAWQAVASGKGAAIAAVTPAKGGDQGAGKVELWLVDGTGKPSKQPTVVSAEASAELDLDMVRVGSNLVLAWSDQRAIDSRIFVSVVDDQGKIVKQPAPATEPRGDQALVRLVAPAGKAPAYLAWESLVDRPRNGRSIRLAPLLADGSLGHARGEVTMQADDGTLPELSALPGGVAALTLAAPCKQAGECASGEPVPTYVELDRQLGMMASEPLLLKSLAGAAPGLAWGLRCDEQGCLVLAAKASTPAPVFAVVPTARGGQYQPMGRQLRRPEPPRMATLESIAETEPLADLSAARVGDGVLAAWVTYFDPMTPYERRDKPAPDGRYAPLRAQLFSMALSDTGKPSRHNLSLRARSFGGVALSPGQHNHALVVWSAIERDSPQVFTTLVNASGRRRLQRMLTRSSGEVSDVTATRSKDGWLVGWIDERDGDPEVYATRLDGALVRRVPERRVTNSTGAATGLALLGLQHGAIGVWADARGAVQQGWADVYAVRLDDDASPVDKVHRLAETPLHSYAPVLARFGKGAVVAWLEGHPDGGDQGELAGVRIAQLDEGAHVVSPPGVVPANGGLPTALTLDCGDDRCHVVMAVDLGDFGELQAFVWQPGEEIRVVRLASLTGPAAQAVTPVLVGRQLFFADQTSTKQGRVRRMLIDWQ